MRFRTLFAAIFLATTFLSTSFSAETKWDLDAVHSTVGFQVTHMMVSRVNGNFREFSGEVMADAKTGQLTSVHGKVNVASIDTNNKMRDDHLKAADFFDAAKFPEMSVKSKKVTFDGGKVTIVADLTIRDVTKEVTFTGEHIGLREVPGQDGPMMRTGYSFTSKINRKDFGLNFAKVVDGTVVVSDEVMIDLQIQLTRKI